MHDPVAVRPETKPSIFAPGAMLERMSCVLNRWSRPSFLGFTVSASLALSVAFFAPKLWLMTSPRPGAFEWDRALTFLHQCRDPFAVDVEPAMRWRLLPPLVAHALGLTGYAALLIPYAGVVALLAVWCATVERLAADRLSAFLLTVLLATTSSVLSVTTMLGINDGWFLLGLVAVAGGRTWPSLVIAALLAPWVDERFLFGYPSALFCRWWLQGRPPGFWRQVAIGAAALLPYALLRIGYSATAGDRGSGRFVSAALSLVPTYLPFARLGWWMGFRLAWPILLIAPFDWYLRGSRTAAIRGAVLALAGWTLVTLLAADLSRSVNMLLPVLLCGAVALPRYAGSLSAARCWLAACAAANLLIPFVHVTYNKLAPVWGLPLELLRLVKNTS